MSEKKHTKKLQQLSKEIIQYHEAVEKAGRTMLQKAREAGKRLTEAKRLIPHGQYQKWVVDNHPFGLSTAGLYRLVDKAWDHPNVKKLRKKNLLDTLGQFREHYYSEKEREKEEAAQDKKMKCPTDEEQEKITRRTSQQKALKRWGSFVRKLTPDELKILITRRQKLEMIVYEKISQWMQGTSPRKKKKDRESTRRQDAA